MNGTTDTPLILTPIRYPLTAESTRTLEHASHVSEEHDDGQLLVLHVDLVQYDKHSTAQDIQRAIAPIVGDQPVNVIIRRGFLVEEVIREEAEQRGAEIIVIGKNRMAKWRRYINRLLGNHPDIASYLREHTDATIETTG
ncbi:universal stress protein (plasmid) [Halorarum halophilum]|uniref:Universal stress protein n=1 Tax=Halorarum halophilum TaxID=2743090 RepID=A0A7D5KW44_9EURY|nr:universal stress protein [Halobaculum halophilum]QLG29840.1 universal stress protein [Halobaculum halophilum]